MTTLLVVSMLFAANAYDEAFNAANNAYTKNDYAQAIQGYEQLVAEQVVDPAVFYNLANAYYRNGNIGAAIANYERTLQLNPNFINAYENLSKCVNETERHLGRPQPPEWQQSLLFWHYDIAKSTTNGIAVACWLLVWALLAVRLIRPFPYARTIAAITLVVAIAFGLSAWMKQHPTLLAVANADKIAVYYGTNDQETVHYELFKGDRVTVDRRERGWARVTTVDGKRGWAHEDALVLVGPPYLPPAPASPKQGVS